ncbi:helix-turn-helix domain-containing protein [Haloarculaceae archaeon H-GB2-1]|nr:helix-turn-helix domain-containing protein [Haloarculaceae archaeon H-GB1-1]MEA5387987.1 helix-turn-helix domain-containing protein [Haloarculaceae archaeon H-GB11]MEA5409477.1 helix-turn-helix domain-containing protein [Haloarculaceae archaeon H-GB2-1]
MITARIAVLYEGDWTAKSTSLDVYGKFLAYTSQNNRYYALVVLTTPRIDSAVELVRTHESITEVNEMMRTETSYDDAQSVTLFVKSKYREIPPMEMLTYEGFFPIGHPTLEDGRIVFDLLLNDREGIDDAIELLHGFGNVSVEYLSEDLRYQTAPNLDEFEDLIDSISPRQLEVLSLAVSMGYFDDRRQVTVEDLADELDITKTTASKHLRKARLKVLTFLDRYLSNSV